jgi:hypothetical protein
MIRDHDCESLQRLKEGHLDFGRYTKVGCVRENRVDVVTCVSMVSCCEMCMWAYFRWKFSILIVLIINDQCLTLKLSFVTCWQVVIINDQRLTLKLLFATCWEVVIINFLLFATCWEVVIINFLLFATCWEVVIINFYLYLVDKWCKRGNFLGYLLFLYSWNDRRIVYTSLNIERTCTNTYAQKRDYSDITARRLVRCTL